MIFYKRKGNDWRLWSVILYLINSNKYSSLHLLFWLIIQFLIRGITTYLTVTFLSSANLKILCLLLINQSIESFVGLRIKLTEKSFILKCIRGLHTLVYKRLLGTDWYRLKLADHEEMRRKMNEACSSIHSLIEIIIEQSTIIYALINDLLTIILLCPWKATLTLTFIYFLFFIFYVRKRSKELFQLRVKHNTIYDELQIKYNRIIGRTLDYVLHRERDKLIETSSSIQVIIYLNILQINFHLLKKF